RRLRGHQQQRSSTIRNLRRITCRDSPVLRTEAGLQASQLFKRGVAPNGFIGSKQPGETLIALLAVFAYRYWNNLLFEIPSIRSNGRTTMAFKSECVQLITADLPFFRDRKSTRLNSSHVKISYADFCL